MLFRSRRTPYATLVALLVLMLFATPSSADSLGVNVELVYDKFPFDITWSIKRYVDDLRTWENAVAVYANDYDCAREYPLPEYATHVDFLPLEGLSPGEYAFRIEDSWGDGLCCTWGDGSYRVTGPDGVVIAEGGADLSCGPIGTLCTTTVDFTLEEAFFEDPSPPTPFPQICSPPPSPHLSPPPPAEPPLSPPPLPTEAAPGVPFDPKRGNGLPLCKCDVYHNGAFVLMSRMCQKEWGGQNICYPTRVVYDWSQGTVVNGRYLDNRCDDHMTMCSPWSPPDGPTA